MLFGRGLYEDSKQAAAAVGIGSVSDTAASHCLYVITGEALGSYIDDFERITKGSDDHLAPLVACSAMFAT